MAAFFFPILDVHAWRMPIDLRYCIKTVCSSPLPQPPGSSITVCDSIRVVQIATEGWRTYWKSRFLCFASVKVLQVKAWRVAVMSEFYVIASLCAKTRARLGSLTADHRLSIRNNLLTFLLWSRTNLPSFVSVVVHGCSTPGVKCFKLFL